jgi:transcriptional regulator with XRE-family HTH domain
LYNEIEIPKVELYRLEGGMILDYFHILGANVKALRTKRKLTQEQLADRCDLHRTYIGAIERGERNVSLKNIVILAQALDVTPAGLLTNQEKPGEYHYETDTSRIRTVDLSNDTRNL